MHADPVDATRAMREKRLDLLKESQIRSWLSSYQQKQKRENERLAADLWQLQGQLTFSSRASTAASVKGNNLPTTAPATTITPCTSATTQNGNILSSIKTDAIFNSSYPSITSAAVTLIPTQRPFTSVTTLDSTEPSVTSAATLDSTQPSVTSADQPQHCKLTYWVLMWEMEWYFSWSMSQSTINNRNRSNVCF